MAHSWIPKRAYGEGYIPFLWEMPSVIDTIWFNEGFGRYAAIAALADGMPAHKGREFRQAQLDRRVQRAQTLMRDPRASLAEIARSTGFADQHHLARVFRRITGITPITYRRSL